MIKIDDRRKEEERGKKWKLSMFYVLRSTHSETREVATVLLLLL